MARPPSSGATVLNYLLAIFLPPVSVFLVRGCHADFWINIALSFLAWLPGVIHAWWVISKSESTAPSRAAEPAAVSHHHQQQHYGATNQPPVQQPVGGNKY